MYDYMRTLQKQFEPQPEFFQNLDGDIRQIHKQLSARLESEDRKLLLKLKASLPKPKKTPSAA